MTHDNQQEYTNVDYWQNRLSQLNSTSVEKQFKPFPTFIESFLPILREYAGQNFIELGCEPGVISSAIASKVPLQFSGVDFLPDNGLYVGAMKAVGVDAVRITSTIHDLPIKCQYDVIGSFGLIEHFEDPMEIMSIHDRHLRPGGLCIITLPNFRQLQYIYHRLFDSVDLQYHNLAIMAPKIIRECGELLGHEVIICRHVGKLQFWGLDRSGNRFTLGLRAFCAGSLRIIAKLLSKIVPEGHPSTAPFIVYVGRKKG